MSFLAPLMLAALVSAAVPVILHLLNKRQPKERPFAAITLVLKSIDRVERRFRLKRFLLLACRILILAAFALAAARPVVTRNEQHVAKARGPERLAVIIDGSLSMRARLGGSDESGFQRAKEMARNLLAAMSTEDLAILVVARGKPQTYPSSPTGSQSDLLSALSKLEPTFEHAELSRAVAVAVEALGGAQGDGLNRRVVVLSDLAEHGLRAGLGYELKDVSLSAIDVWQNVGTEARGNRAMTKVAMNLQPNRGAFAAEAVARIRSFEARSNQQTIVGVALRSKDELLFESSVDLERGAYVDQQLPHDFGTAGRFAVRAEIDEDALIEDNTRYAIVDVRPGARTLVIDGAPSGIPKEDEVYYLVRALEASDAGLSRPSVATDDALLSTNLADYNVIVLAGLIRLDGRQGRVLETFVRQGGGLLISMSGSVDPDSYNAAIGQLLPRRLRGFKRLDPPSVVGFKELDREHPILDVFAGDGLSGLISSRTHTYMRLEPDRTRPARTLVEYQGGDPAIIETAVGAGRVLLLTTSVDRDLGDLPIRPGFLPLMQRSVRYLAGALRPSVNRAALVGEPHALQTDAPVVVIDPSGARSSAKAEFFETSLPGIYEVEGQGPAFVVNVDPRESDLEPLDAAEAAALLGGSAKSLESEFSGVHEIARGAFTNPDRLASWLLIMMLIAFLVESIITTRTPRV